MPTTQKQKPTSPIAPMILAESTLAGVHNGIDYGVNPRKECGVPQPAIVVPDLPITGNRSRCYKPLENAVLPIGCNPFSFS